MTLANPIFLAPIIIPTTGVYLSVEDGASADVTLTAGTYYWGFDESTVGSFNEHLATQLDAAYGGGAWAVAFSSTTFKLTISYTGASTPTSLVFDDVDVLDATDLGASATADQTTITLTAKSYTSTYQARWMWRPAEYLIDDQTYPKNLVVVATSPFDGSSTVDRYGEWKERVWRLEAVKGARVYDWAVTDATFAAAASLATGEPWGTLEAFWRDCSSQTTAVPVASRIVLDESDWINGTEAPHDFTWIDAGQLSALRDVASLLNEAPLLYTVSMRVRDDR